jgi:hypothetical protein
MQASVKEYIDGAAFFTREAEDRVDFVRELVDGSQTVLLSSNEGECTVRATCCQNRMLCNCQALPLGPVKPKPGLAL